MLRASKMFAQSSHQISKVRIFSLLLKKDSFQAYFLLSVIILIKERKREERVA